MNSTAFSRIEARFAGRPPLDLVACARVLSRGHAAHATELGTRRGPSRSQGTHERYLARAHEFDRFWAAVALHAAFTDLAEEHAATMSATLLSDPMRFRDRHARNIADPPLAEAVNRPMRLLLPPRRCLPAILPSALEAVFGFDLDITPSAHAA